MVIGGSRREEAPVINSTNVFAALGSLKKKKKKAENKEQGSSKGRGSSAAGSSAQQPEKEDVFWAPAPLTAKSWADVDDEDDDDYYATTAPPQSVWGAPVADGESEAATEGEAAAEVENFCAFIYLFICCFCLCIGLLMPKLEIEWLGLFIFRFF